MIEEMIERKMTVEPKHIFLPNMCLYIPDL